MNWVFSIVSFVCLAIGHKFVRIIFPNSLLGAIMDVIGNLSELAIHLGPIKDHSFRFWMVSQFLYKENSNTDLRQAIKVSNDIREQGEGLIPFFESD
jgi:hypothetical protein